MIDSAGPWGTGPYKLVEGVSIPEHRSDRVVLEAHPAYWDPQRRPRLHRIIFDHTLSQTEAVDLVKTTEGRVDLVTELSPLETLRVAQSPFAKVVKKRGSLTTVFGQFNLKKRESPWHDIRLRQAVNVAINRADLIQYATKGNGEIIPALLPREAFGHDPALTPYPFAPDRAWQLLREAGYPGGLAVTLIAPEDLAVQATVISKMLEQVGFTVALDILNSAVYPRKTILTALDQPAEQQPWDIALTRQNGWMNFPAFQLYHIFALGGPGDWGSAQPALQGLYEQVLGTVDRERQRLFLQQMERYTHTNALFLFLYNPIQLYAVNKAVAFVPYRTGILNLTETSVTAEHWSVRKQKAAGQE
jgi:peptide/nickel transport system substrate-binding protein